MQATAPILKFSWAFTVLGAPRTKKNHGERWKPKGSNLTLTVPSKAWRDWLQGVAFLLPGGRTRLRFTDGETLLFRVNCRGIFYRDANRGDAVGYYQGLADLLEKTGVVKNDAQIVSWDGSRLLIDRKNPRVEVILESAEER